MVIFVEIKLDHVLSLLAMNCFTVAGTKILNSAKVAKRRFAAAQRLHRNRREISSIALAQRRAILRVSTSGSTIAATASSVATRSIRLA
jgi:hypothetical protein